MKALHVRLLAVSLILLLLLSSVAAMGLRPWSVAYAAGTISGTVFADYNSDGVQNNAEIGIGDITVTAYDSAGAMQGTATSFATICVGAGNPAPACTGPNTPALGTYSLNATGTGPYRIEFSGWPAYLQPARHGTGNGTSVQFVPDGNSTDINFGLHNPAEYCQDNPNIASSCYSNGDPLLAPTGAFPAANLPALVQIPFVPPDTGPGSNTYLATGAEIGATWSLTYQRSSQTLLAAAVVRRHSGFGPGGIGAIYAVDLSGGTRSVLLDLNTVGYSVGTLPPRNLPPDSADENHDPDAFDAVGKLGIGGISLSEDEETLWVMNLFSRSLLEIRVGVPATTPTAADITVHPVPDPGCTSGVFRPWAVKTYRGQVYIGGVCSGELPYVGKNVDTSHLQAYIYRHDPAGAVGNFTPVYNFPLDYPRGLLSQEGGNQPSADWLPWINEWGDINAPMPLPGGGPFTQTMYPQPMLTAIEFDADGAMVLGLLDRAGMQLGNENYSTLAADTVTYEGVAGGDTLRLCVDPAGGYVLESNSACAATGLTGTGPGNNQGPGGGEFFGLDGYGGTHEEVTLGGLALHPGRREVVSTAYDPDESGPFRSGGFRWFDTTDGTRPRTYLVFGQDAVIGNGTVQQPSSMGKAAGLGDVELLCDQAPIQIGNRVWLDVNVDGIQDPGEPPLAGVEVELWRDGTLIETTTTNTDGEYYFNDLEPRTGTPGGDSDYEIRIPADQSSLSGLTATQANADPSSNGESRDSNGTLDGTNVVYRIPYEDLAGAGYNNHTYDFGFRPFSLGNRVWHDVDNDGEDNDGPGGTLGSSDGIDDVTVQLYADTNGNGILDAGDLLMDTVVTSDDGHYLFTNLPSGDYLVHLPAANFQTGGALEGYTSSTGTWGSATGDYEGPASPDPNNDADQDDNGNIGSGGLTTPGLTGGIISQVITLGPDADEPLNESSGPNTPGFPDTTPDNRSNLTLDFGVFQPASIGDFIWNDANNDGIQDAGEPGIPGVTVNLYDDSGTTLIATTTTDTDGLYRFTNLEPTTDYVIRLDNPADYALGGPLVNYQLSPANQGGDDTVDSDATLPTPADPIGLGNYPQMAATTGVAGSDIPTYDAGFFQPLSLGNRVWHDLNNDGEDNDGADTGIGGVTVNLLDSTGTTIIATTTTNAQGYYLFTNLQPGAYIVELDETNFDVGGPLEGYTSSTDAWASATGPYEPGANGNTDGDDNGTVVGTLGTGGSIRSAPVTLAFDLAPTGEPATPGLTDPAIDANSNLTIDFGVFQPASIGDFIWNDANNNGIQDAGELGIPGVTVKLYDDSGTTLIATTTTDTDGLYRFTNLQPTTDYVIRLDNPADYTGTGPLVNYQLSPDNQGGDDTVDSDATLPTPADPIGLGNYPQMAATTGVAGSDIPTYDAGFFQPLSLGNRVWYDLNNDGEDNDGMSGDPGSSDGIDGVTVNLLDSTGTTIIATTTTNAQGYYLFTNLQPGAYIVELDETNFDVGGPLEGYTSSTDAWASATGPYEPGANGNTDGDDNGTVVGTLGTGGSIRSAPVTLAFDLAPTGEPATPGLTDPAIDANSNLTIDFGVFRPLSLGNRVWHDLNNDGEDNDGADTGIGGVTVNLLDSTGTTIIATTTTNAQGYYLFTNLQPGAYIVELDETNFDVGGPLEGYTSSTDAWASATGPYEPGANGNTDGDDNGTVVGTLGTGGSIRSAPVTLAFDLAPTGEPATPGLTDPAIDANSNLTIDFGVFQPASIGDFIWNDANNNGIQDAGELGIPGVTVKLYDDSGTTLIATTTTDTDGLYRFTNLQPTTDYVIRLDNPADYTGTGPLVGLYPSPSEQGGNVTVDSNAVLPTPGAAIGTDNYPQMDAPTGAPGSDIPTYDAGFFRLLSLGDLVWHDTNNNGRVDPGESGIDGVVVQLYRDTNGSGVFDAGDQFIAETITSGGGLYRFDGLLPGDYLVVLPAGNFSGTGMLVGYTSSTGNDSEPAPSPNNDVNNDDNGTVIGTLAADGVIASSAVTLTPNQEPTDDGDSDPNTNLTIDFGVFILSSLGDRVWFDTNRNGIQDAGEAGVPGVTVTLYRADGTEVAMTTTDGNGTYGFTSLQPGEYYLVFSNLPPGYAFTELNQGGDTTRDSDADPSNGRTTNITLGPGQHDPTWDAGIYQLAGLGDYVWEDLNRNGIQDTDEPPVSGVRVILRDGNGNLIRETTTNDQGYYFFGDLVPGSYQVEFEPPSGYRFTLPNQGTDRARDSNVDPTTRRTEIIDLAVGESNPTIDAGLYRPASLGDRVWLDTNGNGIQDNGEPGVPGVTVRLLDGNGDPVRNPDGTPRTVTTDAEGRYQFTDLTPGLPYQVEFVLPAGYAFTLPDRGTDDTRDSDADPSNGRTSIIRLRSGENNLTIDAGLYRLLSLGDLVWLDANNNGMVDAGEQGVAGVTVRLYRATNGQPVGDPIAETTTDSNGNYLFMGLTAGDYIVEIVPPDGYRSSTGRNGQDSGPYEPGVDGNSDLNNQDHGTEVNPGIIRSSTVTLTPGGEPTNDGDNDPNTNLTIDFGIFQPASLGSVVWLDRNNDGRRDDGEPGVPGVTVILYDQDDREVARTTTDANGNYLFTHLLPGTYQIEFVPPADYDFTIHGQDSNADQITGRTGPIKITAGDNRLDIWAGLTPTEPTAITLSRFTATREDGQVVVRWETGVEINTWGYQIYRGTNDDRAQATRITPTIILARGRGANGAAYSWNDTTATDDGDYRYWLEEVEVDGTTSIHGPIRINAQTASNTFKVFLPLTVR